MRRCFILSLLLSIASMAIPAQAAETYALTMHGAPALSADFDHYPYADPAAPKGGTLHQAAIGSFDTLNPFTIKGKAAQGLAVVHDRLMDRSWDEPFTLYPLIARSVSIPDDRSSITFHIDPRAKFQDGTPITANDVVYTFNLLKESGRPNMRRVYKLVSSVEQPDSLTIKFTLDAGADRETPMILAIMPILSKAYWSARTFDSATLAPYVASGPYRIKSVEPGRRIVYERVKNYWAANLPTRKGFNNFDNIAYDYFRDDGVAFEALKSGNLNFRRETNITLWAKAYDFPALKDGTMKREAVKHGRAEPIRGFIFNTRRAPFNDIRVREALSLAFDFDWVNTNLFSKQLQRITSYFPNTDLAANNTPPAPTSEKDIRKNLQRADILLKQAGWVVKNGVRIHATTGQPMNFEILLGAREDEKTALAFSHSLKRLGITPRLRTLDAAGFRDRTKTYDFDMMFYFWDSTLSPGGEQMLSWGCAAASEEGRFNYAGICDPAIDKLASNIAATRTRDDLRTSAYALDKLLTSGFYMVPFGMNPADLLVFDAKIKHPATTPLYGVVPETWWIAP
jgi:microcin C transport system substrate-binding protein